MEQVVEELPAREIAIREFNSLRGRLCTVIEAVGLKHEQTRAIVQLIKNLSFQNQNVVEQLIVALDDDEKLFTVVNNRLKLDAD